MFQKKPSTIYEGREAVAEQLQRFHLELRVEPCARDLGILLAATWLRRTRLLAQRMLGAAPRFRRLA